MSRTDTSCTCPRFKERPFVLGLISGELLFGCRRAWFVRGFCSFCSLVWSVRSAVRILSRWAPMRGAVNIESLERSVLLLEWMKSLEVLKQSANADITEIKYVSRLLRDILRDNTSCQVNADPMNHDYSISKISGDMSKRSSTKTMKSSLRFP